MIRREVWRLRGIELYAVAAQPFSLIFLVCGGPSYRRYLWMASHRTPVRSSLLSPPLLLIRVMAGTAWSEHGIRRVL
jgi:hypothetical protein